MTESVKIRKAEKYAVSQRALSNETRVFFMQNFGCARKVYNLYVDWLYHKLEKVGYKGEERIPQLELPEVSEFKKEYAYLKDVDSLGLANAKISFEKALRHFNDQTWNPVMDMPGMRGKSGPRCECGDQHPQRRETNLCRLLQSCSEKEEQANERAVQRSDFRHRKRI